MFTQTLRNRQIPLLNVHSKRTNIESKLNLTQRLNWESEFIVLLFRTVKIFLIL